MRSRIFAKGFALLLLGVTTTCDAKDDFANLGPDWLLGTNQTFDALLNAIGIGPTQPFFTSCRYDFPETTTGWHAHNWVAAECSNGLPGANWLSIGNGGTGSGAGSEIVCTPGNVQHYRDPSYFGATSGYATCFFVNQDLLASYMPGGVNAATVCSRTWSNDQSGWRTREWQASDCTHGLPGSNWVSVGQPFDGASGPGEQAVCDQTSGQHYLHPSFDGATSATVKCLYVDLPAITANISYETQPGTFCSYEWSAAATGWRYRYWQAADCTHGLPPATAKGVGYATTGSGIQGQFLCEPDKASHYNHPNLAGATSARIYCLFLNQDDDTAPAQVSLATATSPTYPMIRLTWNAPGDDGLTGRASRYEIRYGTAPINNAASCAAAPHVAPYPPTPLVAGTVQSVDVRAWQLDVDYYFCLFSYDEVGNRSDWTATATHHAPPVDIMFTTLASDVGGALATYQSHLQTVVQTDYGIFASFGGWPDTGSTFARILRSIDGGATWTVLLAHPDYAAGIPLLSTPEGSMHAFVGGHACETPIDAQILNYYPDGRFSHRALPSRSQARKSNAVYDPHRRFFYFANIDHRRIKPDANNGNQMTLMAECGSGGNFFRIQNIPSVIDSGNVKLSTQWIWKRDYMPNPPPGSGPGFVDLQYAQLGMHNSELIYAWTSVFTDPVAAKTNYYSIQYITSSDGGISWRRVPYTTPAFTEEILPTPASDSNTVTLPDEHYAGPTQDGYSTWLSGMGIQGNRLHMAYNRRNLAGSQVDRSHYTQFNWTTGTQILDSFASTNYWTVDGIAFTQDNSPAGFFVVEPWGSAQASPLYYVTSGPPAPSGEKQLYVLISNDEGLNWHIYAQQIVPHSHANWNLYGISGMRRLTNDGFIIGSLTITEGGVSQPAVPRNRVVFFKIPAGIPMGNHTDRIQILKEQIIQDGGNLYRFHLPPEYTGRGFDTQTEASRLELIEQQNSGPVTLGPAHTDPAVIQSLGGGRFYHDRNYIYFSTSDNSNPLTNGRGYSYRFVRAPRSAPVSPAAPAFFGKLKPEDMTHVGGHRYKYMLDFDEAADTAQQPTQSRLQLFEDGFPLGPPHSLHDAIQNFGAGRYSHWKNLESSDQRQDLYFSSSDYTDPRTNGRSYSWRILPP